MANFDQNEWYQLTVGKFPNFSMYGTSLFDHGVGAVFFTDTNTTKPTEKWQLYPFNSSVYMLRSQDSGHNGYLAAAYSANETTPGGTLPQMRNYTLSDNSMFWQITPWGDGTFYLTNLENGTAWHLEVNSNALMSLSSNFTMPQEGGAFSFKKISAISDSAFSTINTPPATSTPTGTSTPTNTSSTITSISTTPSTSPKGLSTGAAAGIGASIGIVALLLIVGGLLFWFRRRKRARHQDIASEHTGRFQDQGPEKPTTDMPKELQSSSSPRPAELMAHTQPPELPVELNGQSWSELPGESTGHQR